MGKRTENEIRTLSVASVIFSCHQNPNSNLHKMTSIIEEIMNKRPGTNLIVFGQMSLGWYDPASMPEYHKEISMHLSYDSLGIISEQASKFGVYICLGFSEKDEGFYYNSQVLFDRFGDPRSVHRKFNLSPGERKCGYHPGTAPFTVTGILGKKTVITTLADLSNFSTVTRIAMSRPEVVIVPLVENIDARSVVPRFMARAFDAWLVTANRYGIEEDVSWNGFSFISDPRGRIVRESVGKSDFLLQDMSFPGRNILLSLPRGILVRLPLPLMAKAWKKELSLILDKR